MVPEHPTPSIGTTPTQNANRLLLRIPVILNRVSVHHGSHPSGSQCPAVVRFSATSVRTEASQVSLPTESAAEIGSRVNRVNGRFRYQAIVRCPPDGFTTASRRGSHSPAMAHETSDVDELNEVQSHP